MSSLRLYLIFLLINFIFVNSVNSLQTNKLTPDIDFEKAVEEYCKLRERKNFCADHSIRLMLDLDKKRKQALEMERNMKRMESEINKKLSKIFN